MPSRLQRVVALLRGTGCDHLVRYSERVLILKGVELHAPSYSVDVGSLGTKVEPVYKAAQLAFILDDCQYTLCLSIENGEMTRVEGGRLRTMVILGITQLRLILESLSQQPSERLQKHLEEWIEYMGSLVKQVNGRLGRVFREKSFSDTEVPSYSPKFEVEERKLPKAKRKRIEPEKVPKIRSRAARGEATRPLKEIAAFLNVSLEEVDEALK